MTITATLRRAVANVLAIGAIAALLSACTLTSATNLVSPDEAVEPLPAAFNMAPYGEENGVYTRSEDPAIAFTLKDRGYTSADGAMTAYFVERMEAPDTYLVALGATDGITYGVARLRGEILELAIIYGTSADEQLKAAGEPVPAGVFIDPEAYGQVTLTDRAQLDAMIALHFAGKAKLDTSIVWVGAGEAPLTIKRDGDWYTAG